MKKLMKITVIILVMGCLTTSCASVKAYEKVMLNDREMKLSPKLSARFELQFHTYREAASGANGGKTGGGCGCN